MLKNLCAGAYDKGQAGKRGVLRVRLESLTYDRAGKPDIRLATNARGVSRLDVGVHLLNLSLDAGNFRFGFGDRFI